MGKRTWGMLAMASMVGCAADSSIANDEPIGTTAQRLLAPTLGAYSYGATAVINFDSMSGAASDWIAIAPASYAPDKFVAWKYTGPAQSGSVSFDGLPPGTYVARAYYNWPTGAYTIQQTSAAFTIGQSTGTPTVTPPGGVALSTPFSVAYAGMPGNRSDWIAVAPAGSPNSTVTQWKYTNGAVSGSASFTGLTAGSYVARAFRCWDCTTTHDLLASAEFTVGTGGGTTALTAPASPTANTAFSVGFTSMPGSTTDWIAVAAASSPSNTFVAWKYTNGAASGSVSFAGLPAGNYEARAYYDWAGTSSYTVRATAAFTIGAQSYPNCKAILTANPASPTGMYTINPAGGALSVYCDMTTQGGGWTEVYDQSTAVGVQSNGNWANGVSTTPPNGGRYTILNRMAAIKSGTNYEFYLFWPNQTGSVLWTQALNPTTTGATTSPQIIGTATKVPSNAAGCSAFVGLRLSSVAQTYLASDQSGCYWFAVGMSTFYNGGFPSYNPVVANRATLYLR